MAHNSASVRSLTPSGATSPRLPTTVEWPTLAVAAAIYLGFGLITYFHDALPMALMIVMGAYLVAWHGSLQHEVIHGHPTPWSWVNRLLVGLPLGLWLPFERYRASHLAHHADENLTDPLLDPESYYLLAGDWAAHGRMDKALRWVHNTVAGRMTLGPLLAMARFASGEWRDIKAAPLRAAAIWAGHLAGIALVMTWVVGVCGISPWWYIAAIAYPGLGLALLRSFLEHQARPGIGERTVIIDAETPLSLLFLNNNLHALHHAAPGAPWYRLPAMYQADRARWLARNGGYHFRGYWEVICRYLLWPKEAPVHPGWRAQDSVDQMPQAANTPLSAHQQTA